MEPFISLTGVAAPLPLDDVNTDQIAPAERGHGLTPDLKAMLFSRWKAADPNFVLNRPQFKQTRILVSRENFGCGSSRENAVWALTANGIRCVIARSIADIFKENCLRNGVLTIALPEADWTKLETSVTKADGARPVSVDLKSQTITLPEGGTIKFDIAPAEKTALLEGLDDIGLTLKNLADIKAFEQKWKQAKPWLQRAEKAS